MKNLTRNLAIVLILSIALCLPAQAASIIEHYRAPDAGAKGMMRYWIPYAIETYEQLEGQMTDLYNAGFGGVEIAFFPANVSFDNSQYGWATEAWRETMKNILKIASTFEGGFIVDFTITPGWPVALNTIDPNDNASDQQLTTAWQKVSDVSGAVDMPMPPIATTDFVGNPFIMTDDLVAAVVGRVASIDEAGVVALDRQSLQVIDTTPREETTVAGIPSVAGLAEDSDAYQYVLGLYEGQIPDTSRFFLDSAGNPIDIRTPLDDTQHYWTADLGGADFGDYAPSAGEDIAVGDYVLYGFYRRGTGGTTLLMGKYGVMEDALPGLPYYTNALSIDATNALIAFMDEHLFCDEELVSLMQAASATVGGAIFEDSLENVYPQGIVWTEEYLECFEREMGYSAVEYLPFITGSALSADGDEARYWEDFNAVVGRIYQQSHLAALQDYINEKTGFAYRAQPYLTRPGFLLDLSATSAQVDISEGESLAFGVNFDSFRLVAAGVHIADKKLVSDEAFAIQEGITYNLPWGRVVNIMNENFAAGVNRLIFHGAAYDNMDSSAVDAASFTSGWPGWHAFDRVCTDPWDARMPAWEDIDILADYIARTQAVLQNGTAKMDLLVYDPNSYDHSSREREGDNSAFTGLLSAGYSYDCVMTQGLQLAQNVVTDGILCGYGPAYKAVVVNDVAATSEGAMRQLLTFAEAGLPIVFYGCAPTLSNNAGDADEAISALSDAILATGNAAVVATEGEAIEALASFGVTPHAAYDQENLRTILREDEDGSRYYFVYNHGDQAISTQISFAGTGNAYEMNAWNGDIQPLAAHAQTENGVETQLHLEGREATIIAITRDTQHFPAPAEGTAIEAETTEAAPIALDNWTLAIESWGPDYETAAVSDTQKTTIDIGETNLMPWDELAVNADQLAQAGVASMEHVAGIGYYETRVELEQLDGAQLVLAHGDDMVTGITVNGQAIDALNPSSDRFDIGFALVEGENIIQVKLATTLINRVIVEDPVFADFARGTYGLTSAAIVPYAVAK